MKTSTLVSWILLFIFGLPQSGLAESIKRLKVLAPEIPGAAEPNLEGRDIELVLATFEECGFSAQFVMQPYERHARTYREREDFDAIMTVPLHWRLPGYSTSAYIWYQNGAFYNHSRVGPIERIKDLAGLNVVTFRQGVDVLGISNNVPEFASLTEIADHTIHSRLLFMGRVDAILADGFVVAEVNRRIFLEKRRGENWPSQSDTFRFAPIFNPAPHKMVFRNPDLAAAFDQCFDDLRQSEVIADINQKYIDKYQHVLRFRYLAR